MKLIQNLWRKWKQIWPGPFLLISTLAYADCQDLLLPPYQARSFVAYSLGEADFYGQRDLEYFLYALQDVAQDNLSKDYFQDLLQNSPLKDLTGIWALETRMHLAFKDMADFISASSTAAPTKLKALAKKALQRDFQAKFAERHMNLYREMVARLTPMLQASPLAWEVTNMDITTGILPVLHFSLNSERPLSEQAWAWIEENMASFYLPAQQLEKYWREHRTYGETLKFVFYNPDLAMISQHKRMTLQVPHHPALTYGDEIFLPWSIFNDPLIATPLVMHELTHYFESWQSLHLETTTFDPQPFDPEEHFNHAFNLSEIEAYVAQWNALKEVEANLAEEDAELPETKLRLQIQTAHQRARLDTITTVALSHLKQILGQVNNDLYLAFDYRLLPSNQRSYAQAHQDPLALKIGFSYHHPRFAYSLYGDYLFAQSTPVLEEAAGRLTGEFIFKTSLMDNPEYEAILDQIMRPKFKKVLTDLIQRCHRIRQDAKLSPLELTGMAPAETTLPKKKGTSNRSKNQKN